LEGIYRQVNVQHRSPEPVVAVEGRPRATDLPLALYGTLTEGSTLT
jgi:hypothetical protein